jgi:threonine aldolase
MNAGTAGAAAPNFRSDNVATVAPDILRALEVVNHGTAASYGDDEWSRLLNRKFSDLFETEVTVFPVSTGTAANALSLATCARPWGGIYCHEQAHIHTAEGGATEAFSGGAKLIALPGANGKFEPASLAAALARAEPGIRNRPQPDAVSVTQASEAGTVYRREEIAAIGAAARNAGVRFHMDGARLANALATLGCSPADITWRAGVDILSFGATKNGAMTADAIVVFDPELAEPLSYRLRRAGQAWSKMRFAAAQLLAYVEDQLYLRLATRANELASRLGGGLQAIAGVRLVAPVEANLVFAALPEAAVEALAAAGARFARRGGGVIRLVTRFDGTQAEVDQFIALARRVVAEAATASRSGRPS